LLKHNFLSTDIRDGQELPPIGHQKYYDFEHQNIDPTTQLTRVMPGDRLLLTCTWSSIGRTTTTRFGESTDREMCFNFMAYYPKMDQFACFSLQPFWSGVLGKAPLDIAVCAPELNLGSLGSIQSTLAIINATSVTFDRSEGYIPADQTVGDCTRSLPLCGNGQVDTGEDCEKGDGCSACKCMQGWFPDRSTSICSSEPLKVDFLATSNGIATLASWVVAGVFLLILIFLALALLLPKRRATPARKSPARSPKKDQRRMRIESEESNSDANVPLAPSSGRKAGRRDAGSDTEDDPASEDAGSMDEDADSIDSSSHREVSPKAAKGGNKKKKVSSTSSSEEDEEEDSEEPSQEESSDGSDVADEEDSEASSSGGDEEEDDDDEDDESSGAEDSSDGSDRKSSSSSSSDDDEDSS
jgi:hypothetical protein